MTFEELRTSKRWTRKLLSDKLGISRQAIQAWERNNIYPSFDKIAKIAEILETTPAIVFNSFLEQNKKN